MQLLDKIVQSKMQDKCCFYHKNGNKCLFNAKYDLDDQKYCKTHYNYIKSREDCAVCLDNCPKNRHKLACGHIFHIGCLAQVINTQCPLCRSDFTTQDMMVIYHDKIVKPVMNEIFEHQNFQVCHMIIQMLCVVKRGDWHLDTMNKVLEVWNRHRENVPLLYNGLNAFMKIMDPPNDPRL